MPDQQTKIPALMFARKVLRVEHPLPRLDGRDKPGHDG